MRPSTAAATSRSDPSTRRLRPSQGAGAGEARGPDRHPAPGRGHPPRQDQRRQRGRGRLRARAAARSGQPRRLRRGGGDLPRERSVGEAVRAAAAAGRVHHRQACRRSRRCIGVARIFEQNLGQPEQAFVVLQAAFREDYSNDIVAKELERLATATSKWSDLLTEYTQIVQTIPDRRPRRDLWVKIGRWYGEHLSHLEYAIHSVQQALRSIPTTPARWRHGRLQRKRGTWSELIETLSQHADLEQEPREEDRALPRARRAARERRCRTRAGDPRLPAGASTPTTTPRRRSSRSTGCTAAPSSGPLIDVLGRRRRHRGAPSRSIKFRLEVGQIWDLRLYDAGAGDHRLPGRSLDIDPRNLRRCAPSSVSTRRPDQSEKYLEVLEQQLDAHRPTRSASRSTSAWPRRGRSGSASSTARRGAREDRRDRQPQLRRPTASWRACTSRSGSGKRSSRPTATTSRRRPTSATRVDLYVAMGQVYEEELQDVDRAIEAYNDVLSFDADEPRALDALGRLYEKIRSGTARST